MLTGFRSFAKSKWAVGLLALVGIALLFTGGQQMDVLGQLGPKNVVSAGDRSMSPAEFRAEMTRYRDDAQQRSGQPVSFEQLIGGGQLVGYLRNKSQELGFMNWAWGAGVRPGKELILRQIRQIPFFFDEISGQFSQDRYRQRLAENNMTDETFEASLRDELVTRHFGAAAQAGLRMPRVYGAVFANQARETRDGRWFVVTQDMAGRAPAPTDAQLTEFMNQNAAQLRRPEFRRATLVVFDNPADAEREISEERIQERFNFRRDALSQPERRSFVTLTAPNRAAADRIAAALRSGQTPQAVGAANNLQPAVYNDTPRSAVSDQAVAAGVFGLTQGQVSAPIQAQVGFVVAQLNSVTPGRPATLDEVRSQVIQELRVQDARAAIYERVEAYQKARDSGKPFDQAVTESGARVVPVQAVTQDGRGPNGEQFNVPPLVLQTLWSLGRGAASEVVDLGQGQYFVVRLDEVVAPSLPALADVRNALAQAWTQRENQRLLNARAQALETRIRGGEDIAAVAASAGATLQTGQTIGRGDEARGQGVIAGLFTTAPNGVFSQAQSQDSFVVGRTDRINAPAAAVAATDAEAFRQRMAPDALNGIGAAAISAAAERSRAKYDVAVARQALDLPAEEPAAPAAGAAAPAGRPAPAPAR